MSKFAEETVLITGANRGLGLALALEFSHTHRVIAHARRWLPSFPLMDEWVLVEGDLREQSTIDELERVSMAWDLNILVNNAGKYLAAPMGKFSTADVRELMEVNLLVPIQLTMGLWPIISRNGGVIVNINSWAGKNGSRNETVYSATKHGLRGFSRSLQFDATRDNVRVLDVFLGALSTAFKGGEDKLSISPTDAAGIIHQLVCYGAESMDMREVDLGRRRYS